MEAMAAKIRRSSQARTSTAASSEFNVDMVADFDAALIEGVRGSDGAMDIDSGAAPAPAPAAAPQAAETKPPPSAPPVAKVSKGPTIVHQGCMQKKGDGFGFLSRWQDR